MLGRCASRLVGRRGTSVVSVYASGRWRGFCSGSQADERNPDGSASDELYDVVVVGGGMVGAAVASGLASSPVTKALRVAVIDGSPLSVEKMKKSNIPDPRVSSITPATVNFLKDVGAWEDVVSQKIAPFTSMQVWDYAGQGYTRYSADDVNEPVLGYVVENSVLVTALRSRLQDSNIDMFCPSQVDWVTFPDRPDQKPESSFKWATVKLKDGRSLATRLVVGADGGKSRVRTMAGIDTTGWDYKQEGLICTVRVESHHSTAWQRFLPTGPLALLPLPEDYSNIVWSTTPEKAAELKKMPSEEFVEAVNNALIRDYGGPPGSNLTEIFAGRVIAPFVGMTPSATEPFQFPVRVTGVETDRLSFPLSLRHAKRYVGHRVALVGDAAHTVHPLAGQGVNLGFGDAASLIEVLKKGVECGLDLGEVALLHEYETNRKFANLPMMAVLDTFQRVFAADTAPVNALRAAGFNLVQHLGPLKKLVISSAMSNGFTGIPGLKWAS